MNCYYHRETAALGVCRNCQRGICADCIAEVEPDGIACVNRCERAAASAGRLWSKAEDLNRYWGYFAVLLGTIMAGLGAKHWWDWGFDAGVAYLLATGTLFAGFGVVMLIRLRSSRPT